MITRLIIANGLGQGRISDGLADVRNKVMELNPACIVTTHSWKEFEKIPELAKEIAAQWKLGYRIVMAGHSWGGWFCVRLARELNKYNIPVYAIVLADGINRNDETKLVISSIKDPLKIPDNVCEVQDWYQTVGILKGSPIETGAYTIHRVHKEVTETAKGRPIKHYLVDEDKEFQQAAVGFATGWNVTM